MLILAIETSCDETAVAVVQGNEKTKALKILSNVVSSQIKIHAAWGGVVPNLAAREHLKNISAVLKNALKKAKLTMEDIDLIATTQGPGLIPALLIGTNIAKTLSYYYQKPLLGVHHIEGHIYANFVSNKISGISNFKFQTLKQLLISNFKNQDQANFDFPVLGLVVSGGHTQLVLMQNHLEYEIIGQTLDDAAGEAFDKVARILDLGYPGGPIVSQRAQQARENSNKLADDDFKKQLQSIHFPRPMLDKKNFDFSFSGLKTAVLYFYRQVQEKNPERLELWKDYICLAFENAITEVLVKKTIRAAHQYQPKTVLLAGGVAANSFLRENLEKVIKKESESINFIKPALELCGDNAAMIGTAAFFRYLDLQQKNQLDQLTDSWKTLEANANLRLA